MSDAVKEDAITIMRKRLIFRSWHRGTREIDLMLGKFADSCIPTMTLKQLELYDLFLNNSDPDIYNWISGTEPVPAEEANELTEMLVGFYR